MGKYTCLICQKEFNSESGVKYHISKTHSQVGHYQCETSGRHSTGPHVSVKLCFIVLTDNKCGSRVSL